MYILELHLRLHDRFVVFRLTAHSLIVVIKFVDVVVLELVVVFFFVLGHHFVFVFLFVFLATITLLYRLLLCYYMGNL